MDWVARLKRFILDHELRYYGFLPVGSIEAVSKILVLLLLFAFSLDIWYSGRFSRCLFRYVCCLRAKSREMKNVLRSKIINLDGKILVLKSLPKSCKPLIEEIGKAMEELNHSTESVEEYSTDNNGGDHEELNSDSDEESEISTLKRLIVIEKQIANAARAELAKERASSATAAEEAMAMILHLQNEKSLIELELSQYKRLAEEKQIHDQEVIRSLQWLVLRHESERTLLEDQLKVCRQNWNHHSKKNKQREENEPSQSNEAQSSFNRSIWDTLENVLYSSREATS